MLQVIDHKNKDFNHQTPKIQIGSLNIKFPTLGTIDLKESLMENYICFELHSQICPKQKRLFLNYYFCCYTVITLNHNLHKIFYIVKTLATLKNISKKACRQISHELWLYSFYHCRIYLNLSYF